MLNWYNDMREKFVLLVYFWLDDLVGLLDTIYKICTQTSQDVASVEPGQANDIHQLPCPIPQPLQDPTISHEFNA